MKCSYCGKRSSVIGNTEYASHNSRGIRSVRPDDVLDAICSDCDGNYATLRIKSMIRRGMGIQLVKHKLEHEKLIRLMGWTQDRVK